MSLRFQNKKGLTTISQGKPVRGWILYKKNNHAFATNLKSKTWHHRAHEEATKDAKRIINEQLKTVSRWLEQFALVTNNMIHFI